MNNAIFTLLAFSLFEVSAFSGIKTTIEFNKAKVEPQSYLYEMPKMCYRGDIADVPALIREMMSSDKTVLHQDQWVIALRYGNAKLVYDLEYFFETTAEEEVREEMLANNPSETKAWTKYDVKSDDVLILSNLGPQGDGTEMYATIIKPCKKKSKP